MKSYTSAFSWSWGGAASPFGAVPSGTVPWGSSDSCSGAASLSINSSTGSYFDNRSCNIRFSSSREWMRKLASSNSARSASNSATSGLLSPRCLRTYLHNLLRYDYIVENTQRHHKSIYTIRIAISIYVNDIYMG